MLIGSAIVCFEESFIRGRAQADLKSNHPLMKRLLQRRRRKKKRKRKRTGKKQEEGRKELHLH
jgi:hypothetical protein